MGASISGKTHQCQCLSLSVSVSLSQGKPSMPSDLVFARAFIWLVLKGGEQYFLEDLVKSH